MNWYQRFEKSACLPTNGIDEAGNTRDTPNEITVKSFRQMLMSLLVTILAIYALISHQDIAALMKFTLFFSIQTAVYNLIAWGSTIDWYADDDIRFIEKVPGHIYLIILTPPLVILLLAV